MGKLEGSIVPVSSLSDNEVGEMYSLISRYYDRLDQLTFNKDLKDKEDVIMMRDSGGSVKGFSTQQVIHGNVDGGDVRCLFSGDTIIDREYWGEQVLSSMWINYALQRSEETEGKGDLYWFLMSKGFRTYRYLPTFFNEFYPRVDTEIPEKEKGILDYFAGMKYPNNYDSDKGLVLFGGEKDSLASCVCDVPERVLKNKHVKYFFDKNPGWARGDELCCIALIYKENFKRLPKDCC